KVSWVFRHPSSGDYGIARWHPLRMPTLLRLSGECSHEEQKESPDFSLERVQHENYQVSSF
ncbi:MAG: hypothetical protein OXN25_11340, partial [Candidatus Poribacteria bacterium]|nr:hypothetical protein [Candidatus Poribacteria bacterium]